LAKEVIKENKNDVKEFIDRLLDSHISLAIVTTHRNADPDAVASVYAFNHLLKKIKGNVRILNVLPEGLSAVSKRLIEYLNVSLELLGPSDISTDILKNVDAIIVLDTCSSEQLGPLKDILKERYRQVRIFVIDHHFAHKDLAELAYAILILKDARATAEIIYTLYDYLNIQPTEDAANLLLAGIVYDTRHFILARAETFNVVASLIKYGAKYTTVLKALQSKMETPEKIARLKAAQRMQIHRIDKWIIVTTHVGAYEASAARALLDLGADVAFVASEDKGEVRVSVRARDEFYRETGIHLGRDIMKPLGEFLHGGGGGHETAAAASGRGSAELALIKCIELLKDLIRKTKEKGKEEEKKV